MVTCRFSSYQDKAQPHENNSHSADASKRPTTRGAVDGVSKSPTEIIAFVVLSGYPKNSLRPLFNGATISTKSPLWPISWRLCASALRSCRRLARSRACDRRGTNHSRTCETRRWNKNLSHGLFCSAWSPTELRARLFHSFWEVSCRTHCFEQNVVAIWRKSVAPSLRFALPQPKFVPTIRGWQSITARWLRPRSWGYWRMGVSHIDSSGLTDGVFAHAAYR